MMGRALELLPFAPAGSVVAVGGLEEAVLKNATLASSPAAPPLAAVEHQADAIVQVLPPCM
jgi:translation elongation factor EF-G